MGLDSIPASISALDSLTILYMNDNQLEYLPSSICSIDDQLDSLRVRGNKLCNPDVPSCILDREPTKTEFFENQNGDNQSECEFSQSTKDLDFLEDLIRVNWNFENDDLEYDEIWTTLNDKIIWHEFIEFSNLFDSILTSICIKSHYYRNFIS